MHKKTPVLESFFNAVAGIRLAAALKSENQHEYFPGNVREFLRRDILYNIYETLFVIIFFLLLLLFFYREAFLCTFFISNQDQALALKVPYIFKVFRTQSCLAVAQQFDRVTFVCEKYSNFRDSKFISMISDFEVFAIMLLRERNFSVLSVQQLVVVYYK